MKQQKYLYNLANDQRCNLRRLVTFYKQEISQTTCETAQTRHGCLVINYNLLLP